MVELCGFVIHICKLNYPVPWIQKSLKDSLYCYPPVRFKKCEKKCKKKPILFVGCSYTFGEALEDDDNMPAKIEKITGRHGYNWGISGYGPAQVLTLLLLEKENHLLNEKPEYIIYTYMFNHIDRFIEYELYDLYRKRNYIPIQKYNDFYKSYVYRNIKDAELSDYLYDMESMDVQLNLFYSIMKDIKNESEKLFPDSKFVVLIYSDINYDLCLGLVRENNENEQRIEKMFEIMYSKEFRKKLEEIGFIVITTEELTGRKMYKLEDRQPKIVDPNYPHPTSKAWDEVVPQLCRRLNL